MAAGDFYVEYVHIAAGSASHLAAGQRVKRGDVLCRSGDVGFCPAPHLHLQVHASAADGAATVPWEFAAAAAAAAAEGGDAGRGDAAGGWLPTAGNWYTAAGLVDPPAAAQCMSCGGDGSGSGGGDGG
eukprot:SAG22_NODE_1792_length_3564_cov_3.463203_3_plen_128_part_00